MYNESKPWWWGVQQLKCQKSLWNGMLFSHNQAQVVVEQLRPLHLIALNSLFPHILLLKLCYINWQNRTQYNIRIQQCWSQDHDNFLWHCWVICKWLQWNWRWEVRWQWQVRFLSDRENFLIHYINKPKNDNKIQCQNTHAEFIDDAFED